MIKYRKGPLFFVALMFFCSVVLPVMARDDDSEGGNKSNASSRVGTITGSVRDSAGRPVASAIVSLLRDAAGEEVVRQTRSDQDGSFAVRTAPGRYILRVVAEGFTTAAFTNVEVGASAELIYRFDLIPAGRGRTAPEQVNNRNDSRFTLRSAHRRRSIFQVDQDEDADLELALERAAAEQNEAIAAAAREEGTLSSGSLQRPRGLVETYYVASEAGFAPHAGVNFAFVAPVRANLEFVVTGQTGTSVAPQRLEATARARLSERHRLSVGVAAARLPVRRGLRINAAAEENGLIQPARASVNSLADVDRLAQISARAIEEWTLPRGVVILLGFDYARFLGAGNADAFMPRFGVQFDADAKTRLRAAYAPGGEETRTETIAGSENGAVSFSEAASQPIVLDGERAVLERSRRLEFGIERLLDEHSSVEATVFFDVTDGRGVGLLSLPMSAFAGETGMSSVVEQQGAARGLRVVYARRLTSAIRASAGYSFGRGQRLAPTIDLINAQELQPDEIFQNGFFQTAAAEVDADVRAGTRVRAVVRFSSRAAVFAIDPFAGRLALYDPSLSFLVTQELPTFGLPVRAEAILDARNLLDAGASVEEGDTILIIGTTRRSLRGGIAVRF